MIESENQIEKAATEDVSQTDVNVDLEVMERQIENANDSDEHELQVLPVGICTPNRNLTLWCK